MTLFSPDHHQSHPVHDENIKAHLIETLAGHGLNRESLRKLPVEHLHEVHKALKMGSFKHAVAKLDELMNQMGMGGEILTSGPRGTKRETHGKTGRGRAGFHWSKNL